MSKEANMSLVRDLKIPVLIIWILSTVFYGLTIWLNNTYSGYGERLAEIEDKTNWLVLENQLLENKIASRSALRHISVKAKEMGFKAPEKMQYIK